MKVVYLLCALAASACSANAVAGCNAHKVSDLTTLLSGKTVCASHNGESWQEFHQANGDLIDYKKGPTDPVDPSEKVGTWQINSNNTKDSTVTHSYGGSYNYTYSVYGKDGGPYSFCKGATEIVATIKSGKTSCP